MKYKVLKHNNFYVNFDLLHEKIVETKIPKLFEESYTIDYLIKQAVDIKDKMGKHFVPDKYFENLKQCHFVTITIQESDKEFENKMQKLVFLFLDSNYKSESFNYTFDDYIKKFSELVGNLDSDMIELLKERYCACYQKLTIIPNNIRFRNDCKFCHGTGIRTSDEIVQHPVVKST